VRKRKLPGPTEMAAFRKEYGEDYFQIQRTASSKVRRWSLLMILSQLVRHSRLILTRLIPSK
jgi:hypothetical protein